MAEKDAIDVKNNLATVLTASTTSEPGAGRPDTPEVDTHALHLFSRRFKLTAILLRKAL